MSTNDILKQLDDRIASRSILDHPFYQAWTAGTLTRADLQTYAASYYPHVAAFPAYLETAAAGAADAAIRAELLDNLREEISEPGDRDQQPGAWIGASDPAQFEFDLGDLAVEIVNDLEQRPDRLDPHRRHLALRQAFQGPGFAQCRETAAQPPLGQQPEHAIARGGPQADQMLTTPEAFTQLTVT